MADQGQDGRRLSRREVLVKGAIGAPCGVRPIARHLHLFDAQTGAALRTGLANAA